MKVAQAGVLPERDLFFSFDKTLSEPSSQMPSWLRDSNETEFLSHTVNTKFHADNDLAVRMSLHFIKMCHNCNPYLRLFNTLTVILLQNSSTLFRNESYV